MFGEHFRKLRDIWCIFKTLRVYGELFNLSRVFGEKIRKKYSSYIGLHTYMMNLTDKKISCARISRGNVLSGTKKEGKIIGT